MSDGGNMFRVYRGRAPSAYAAKAHAKDPRHIRPVSGTHNVSADVAQLVDAKDHLRGPGFISQHDAASEYARQQRRGNGLQNLPVQLTFTPFAVNFNPVGAIQPRLLVPHNPSRYGLVISYQFNALAGLIWYSFGPPVAVDSANLVGIAIPPGVSKTDFYINQTVPIDDIWIIQGGANDGRIVVYEGTIAYEGNQI